ncbi:MAG: class I SAM-dependent methyltransferase [Oscillospiraceae bacterium]|nr:class I SAM-dependent methyltransferase [Oscillospiraceae bacterium]
MNLAAIRAEWTLRSLDISSETAAWDSTAEEYLFQEKINFDEDPFLRFVAEKTALTPEMRTLDVGCGTGAYSVAMAQRVAQADGVDLSPRMVELGTVYAKEHGIDNLRLRVCNWHDCDTEAIRGKYDLVFAHTTPAVADCSTLLKLCEVSRSCCFLCRPARRTDRIFDELRRIAGIRTSSDSDDSVAFAFDTLWGLGYNPEVSYAGTRWRPERSLEDAERWFLGRLRGRAVLSADAERRVKDYLREVSKDGTVREEINTTLVNMYWSVLR